MFQKPKPTPAQPRIAEQRWRRILATAAALLLVLLAAIFAVRAAVWFMSSVTVLSRSNPMPLEVLLYLKLRRAGVTTANSSIQAGDHLIPVQVYTPLHSSHPPVIVLVHGFAAEGNRDDYLDYVANRMALVGFEAVVPTITSEQFFEPRMAGMNDIGETVKWSSQRAHARVSLFGVSFGGGLAVAAAENPAYADDLRMVFNLSGYDSLQRIAHYFIHDRVTGPDGVPYPANPPQSGTVLVALQHLDELAPADQVAALRKALFLLFDSRARPDWTAVEAGLTPVERQSLARLLDVTSPAMHGRYEELIAARKAQDTMISPDGKFGQLRCPLYVLHGSADQMLPAGEAEWARSEIPPHFEAHFLITPEMGHAALATSTKWRELETAFFLADALQAARGSPPHGASPVQRALAWIEGSR